jgi:hypothetical protein
MLHRGAIGLTTDRMGVVAWPEVMPASGGGEAAAALPPRLGSGKWRCNAGEQAALGAPLGLRGGAWSLGRRWERAEGRAHRGGGNGERQSELHARGGSAAPFIYTGSTEGACGVASKEGRGKSWRGVQRPRRTGLAGGRRGGKGEASGREHRRAWARV